LEQLNISQLRNLWLRSPDERLASWREFRIELQSHYDLYESNGTESDNSILLVCLQNISTWWEQAPLVSVAMDPFNPDSWPTVWEILDQGECCKYSRGLAMAYNIHYLDKDVNVTLARVRDHVNNDEYMIATYGGRYALNTLHAQVVDLHSVEYLEVRESFPIRSYLLHNQ
jgi:hypothetical protein